MDDQQGSMSQTVLDFVSAAQTPDESRQRSNLEVGGVTFSSKKDLLTGVLKKVLGGSSPPAPAEQPPVSPVVEPPAPPLPPELPGIEPLTTHAPPPVSPPTPPARPHLRVVAPDPTPPAEPEYVDPLVAAIEEYEKTGALIRPPRIPRAPVAPRPPAMPKIPAVRPSTGTPALAGPKPGIQTGVSGRLGSGMRVTDMRNTGGRDPIGALSRSQKLGQDAAMYHGSPVDVDQLRPTPHPLTDGDAVVFGSPHRGMALSYLAPWSDADFEQYSVTENGARGPLHMREQYPGAFEKVFGGKSGVLYTLAPDGFSTHPALSDGERVTSQAPTVLSKQRISDVYQALQGSDVVLERHPGTQDGTKAAFVFSKKEDEPPPGPGLMEITFLAWAVKDVYQQHQERHEWFERKAIEAARAGNQVAAQQYRYGADKARYDFEAANREVFSKVSEDKSAGAAKVTLTHSYGTRRDRDLELWKAWKAAPGTDTLSPLMKSLDPAIRSEMNRWGGQVPDFALQQEAKKLAVDAIKDYDPNRGAALATHVLNRLQKLSRTVYANQDIARLPEHKKLQTNALWKSQTELTDLLGREPSVAELSDHIGWSKSKVKKVLSSQIGEMVESIDTGGDLFSDVAGGVDVDPTLELIYHDMTPEEKVVFEYTTGWGGRKPTTAAEIARKLGKTPNQVAYTRRRLSQRLAQDLQGVRSKTAQAQEPAQEPQAPPPVVFTDIDGVLAYFGWWTDPQFSPDRTFVGAMWTDMEYGDVLDRAAVARLDALCKAYGAELVISSAWREWADLDKLHDALRMAGFTGPIVGTTPPGNKREAVVKWMLDDRRARGGATRPFVVLDDDGSLAAGMEPSFVLVNREQRLSDNDIREAGARLDRQAAQAV